MLELDGCGYVQERDVWAGYTGEQGWCFWWVAGLNLYIQRKEATNHHNYKARAMNVMVSLLADIIHTIVISHSLN